MKRMVMFSLVLAVMLSASYAFGVQQDFAGMLGEVTIGVNVPTNWSARIAATDNVANNNANNNVTVPCVVLEDKSDPGRWFIVFIADKLDADGHALTLRQVGNNMLMAYRDRGSEKIEESNGRYIFDYYSNEGVARRFVFMDSEYDNRIKAGRCLTYQYSYDTLEPAEVDAITSSITLDGVSRNTGGQTGTETEGQTGTGTGGQTGTGTGGQTGTGTEGQTGGRTDTGTGTGTNTTDTAPEGGGGGGGCSTSTGTIYLLALCAAFIARKIR